MPVYIPVDSGMIQNNGNGMQTIPHNFTIICSIDCFGFKEQGILTILFVYYYFFLNISISVL